MKIVQKLVMTKSVAWSVKFYVLDIGDLPRLLTEYSIRKYYKYSQEKRDNTADAVKLINCFTEKSVLQRIFLKKGLENDVNLLFSHSFKEVINLQMYFWF